EMVSAILRLARLGHFRLLRRCARRARRSGGGFRTDPASAPACLLDTGHRREEAQSIGRESAFVRTVLMPPRMNSRDKVGWLPCFSTGAFRHEPFAAY